MVLSDFDSIQWFKIFVSSLSHFSRVLHSFQLYPLVMTYDFDPNLNLGSRNLFRVSILRRIECLCHDFSEVSESFDFLLTNKQVPIPNRSGVDTGHGLIRDLNVIRVLSHILRVCLFYYVLNRTLTMVYTPGSSSLVTNMISLLKNIPTKVRFVDGFVLFLCCRVSFFLTLQSFTQSDFILVVYQFRSLYLIRLCNFLFKLQNFPYLNFDISVYIYPYICIHIYIYSYLNFQASVNTS